MKNKDRGLFGVDWIKWGDLTNCIFVIFLVFTSGFIIFSLNEKKKSPVVEPEYYLELVNQDTIRVHSISTGKTYTVHPDSLVKVLEYDNM